VARKVILAALSIAAFVIGFWVSAAPFAVGWRLVFWNDPITPQADIAIGVIGLAGGALIAFFATRAAARRWKG
jgi:hypothetical protein